MREVDELSLSEDILNSYIKSIKAASMSLRHESAKEEEKEREALSNLLEKRYSLKVKDLRIITISQTVNNVLDGEIYSLAREKGIIISNGRNRWSHSELERIRKDVISGLAKKLPEIIDDIKIEDYFVNTDRNNTSEKRFGDFKLNYKGKP